MVNIIPCIHTITGTSFGVKSTLKREILLMSSYECKQNSSDTGLTSVHVGGRREEIGEDRRVETDGVVDGRRVGQVLDGVAERQGGRGHELEGDGARSLLQVHAETISLLDQHALLRQPTRDVDLQRYKATVSAYNSAVYRH